MLVFLLVLGRFLHAGKRITKANVDQVDRRHVEETGGIDSGPAYFHRLTEDFVIMKQTTYVYRQGKDTVTIVFKDDKVQSKDSTLSD